LKKCGFLLFIIASLLLAFCLSAAAETPTFSKYFDNEKDMIKSLKAYIKDYPDVFPNPLAFAEGNPDYHLENRQVLLPEITNPGVVLEQCGYGESSWGIGVNYLFYSFKNGSGEQFRLLLYHGMSAEQMQENFMQYRYNEAWTDIQQGVYNDMPYFAYRDNDIDYRYYLLIGDIVVHVIDYEPFSESRIDLIRYKESKLFLPVFVAGGGDGVTMLLLNDVKPFDARVLLFGAAAVLALGIIAGIIWAKKKVTIK